MPLIDTRQFGPFDYKPASVIEFPAGLPGFENERRFVLIERPALAPIVFLQSLESPDICLPAAPVHAIDPAYELAVTDDDLRQLGISPEQPVLALAILSSPEQGPLTANLLAPVVIDPQSRRAVQAVRVDRRYSHRHALKNQEAACS